MGVVTATFGGIIRDVLGNESPIVLSREVYVTAALAGAIVFVVLTNIGLSREVVLGAGLIAGLLVRGMALHKGWSLPRYRERRGRTPDEIDRLDWPWRGTGRAGHVGMPRSSEHRDSWLRLARVRPQDFVEELLHTVIMW
ncbi:TRIC cation channel family protein [Mesorhizobium sp.]|uniref:trimeric intracellular cation channel family protein n=1 Tax=Mesorhizobium sp. TaxID=1871066 RepID=UPI0026BF8847